MPTELIVPLVLGIAAVLQATLNREIANHTGLAAAAALNMLVAAVLALAFAGFCALRKAPDGLLRWQVAGQDFRLFWLLPGLIGFLLVLGLPWVIERAGALATFVVLVAAQVLASTLWDRFAAGIPLSMPRVLGALCTVAGVVLVAWKPAA
jgi:transporter family-2 protein